MSSPGRPDTWLDPLELVGRYGDGGWDGHLETFYSYDEDEPQLCVQKVRTGLDSYSHKEKSLSGIRLCPSQTETPNRSGHTKKPETKYDS